MPLTHSQACTFETCSQLCAIRRTRHTEQTEAAIRGAIRDIVTQLGHHASPYFVSLAGWPPAEIARAVAKGWIRYNRDGNLETL